jgi:hypothetical protein
MSNHGSRVVSTRVLQHNQGGPDVRLPPPTRPPLTHLRHSQADVSDPLFPHAPVPNPPNAALDIAKAAIWYRKVGKRGHAAAQINFSMR